MDAAEAIQKHYHVQDAVGAGLPKSFIIDFCPKGLQQVRGFNRPLREVPPGPRALATVNGSEIDVTWLRPPQDSYFTIDDFGFVVRQKLRNIT
jgi:hypothetical protein